MKFSGELKSTPDDFIVREIDLTGKVCIMFSKDNCNLSESLQTFTNCAPPAASLSASSSSSSRLTSSETSDVKVGSSRFGLDTDSISKLSRWMYDSNLKDKTIEFQIKEEMAKPDRWTHSSALHAEFPSLLFKFQDSVVETLPSQILVVKCDVRFEELLAFEVSPRDVEQLYIFRGTSTPSDSFVDIGQAMTKLLRTEAFRVITAGDASLQLRTLQRQTPDTAASSSDAANDATGFLRVTKKPKKRKRSSTSSDSPCHIHFTLYKRNIESLTALQHIARALGASPADIQVAGTKDKRATTYQRCSVNVNAVKAVSGSCIAALAAAELLTEAFPLAGLNDSNTKIATGNISFLPTPLRLGQLWGNKFTIRLKDFSCEELETGESAELPFSSLEKLVSERAVTMREQGFPNYFGSQRIGNNKCNFSIYKRDPSSESGTASPDGVLLADISSSLPQGPMIGKLLMMGRYEEAGRVLIAGGDAACDVSDETDPLEQARSLYAHGTASHLTILNLLPHHCVRERMLLKGLIRFGATSFKEAFEQIPYNSRMMYVNAYQAFLWNFVACRRLLVEPGKLLLGDLIDVGAQVREATSEDLLDTSPYGIKDCVIPLFGPSMCYPSNLCGEFYELVLMHQGMVKGKTGHAFDTENTNLMYTPNGAYRKLIVSHANAIVVLYIYVPNTTFYRRRSCRGVCLFSVLNF